jgi:hypothetical protein
MAWILPLNRASSAAHCLNTLCMFNDMTLPCLILYQSCNFSCIHFFAGLIEEIFLDIHAHRQKINIRPIFHHGLASADNDCTPRNSLPWLHRRFAQESALYEISKISLHTNQVA